VVSDRDQRFRAKYLVDGSGFRSPIADTLHLRDTPTRARSHTRSLFTHMVGVTPFDRTTVGRQHTQPSPWHQGTLHHVFEGGWLWVIPFDNHESGRNSLVQHGAAAGRENPPKDDRTPEEEFAGFLARFPEIAEQFDGARAVRPWVSTGRLQYSAHDTVGDRYCLTAHAAGFIDALYSRGLANTMSVVNALGHRLIEAARTDDWSTERFRYVDRLQQGLFDIHDDLVFCSFVGFGHYDLWNAVVRVWKATSFMTWLPLEKALSDFRDTGDEAVFDALETAPSPFARLRAADYLPEPLGLAVPDNRTPQLTPEGAKLVRAWGEQRAPERIRPLFARNDGPARTAVGHPAP
jgi:FADH2 O2-dependent halogenase